MGLVQDQHVGARAEPALGELLREVVRRREPVDPGAHDDVSGSLRDGHLLSPRQCCCEHVYATVARVADALHPYSGVSCQLGRLRVRCLSRLRHNGMNQMNQAVSSTGKIRSSPLETVSARTAKTAAIPSATPITASR